MRESRPRKILILTDVDFWRKGAGHRTRIRALITYLSSVHELTVAYTGLIAPGDLKQISRLLHIDFVPVDLDEMLDTASYGRKMTETFEERSFDSVIVEYIHNTALLKYLNLADARIFLDAHDIISERSEAFKKFGYEQWGYGMDEEQELNIFSIYDYVILLCKPDYQKLRSLNVGTKLLLSSHPGEPKLLPLRKTGKKIGFVGSEYLPNADAINFFLSDCWPSVRQHTGAELLIFGNVCRVLSDDQPDGVRLMGYVNSEKKIYRQIDIVVNPVRFGAGLKIKNVEALAFSRPLVTTSHGARGLEKGIGKAFLVADDPAAFAEAVIDLVSLPELRTKLAKRAFDYIKKYHTPDICFKSLLKEIEK